MGIFQRLGAEADAVGKLNATGFSFSEPTIHHGALTDVGMRKLIEDSAKGLGFSTKWMPSGAGHDAQEIAKIGPVGMIFIPSMGNHDRRTRRQGNRPEDHALHHSRGRLRDRLREAQRPRLQLHRQSAPAGQEAKAKKGQQDEIYMPGVRPGRMGQAGHLVNLRRLLRGRRRRNLPDAGRAERRGCAPPPPKRGKRLRWKEGKNMTTLDWSQCPAVESIPGKVSGAWVFKDTRMPVAAVFENLEAGLTVEEVMEEFSITREQINAVLHFAAKSLATPFPPAVHATPADAHSL